MTIQQAKAEIIEMWITDFGCATAQIEGSPEADKNGKVRRSAKTFVLKLDGEYTEIVYRWNGEDLVQLD